MSWITRLKEGIIIETGDGKVYTPEWMEAVMVQEYNFTVFEFSNIDGSFVKKLRPKGRKFAMELYFQGENHIDTAESFRLSAADQRHWHIKHPFYDEIRVQPQSLRFDNREYNVSKISVIFLETNADIYPRGSVSKLSQIQASKATLDDTAANSYVAQTTSIQPLEISLIGANIEVIESSNEKVTQTQADKTTLRNRVTTAQRDLNVIIGQPLQAFRSVQEVINYGYQVEANIKARLTALTDQMERVLLSVETITGRNRKVYYENSAATLVSSAAIATVTGATYASRVSVDDTIVQVLSIYNSYVDALDSMLTDTQGDIDSYNPNPDVISQVQDIVNFTLSNLYEIGLDSKQEHTIINEADSNAVVLTHRVYGLDDQGANIQKFIDTNYIGLKEMLIIPKDRELVYYV